MAIAQEAIQVGTIEIDSPTVCCLGFAVPIVAGDDNFNASATVEYRRQDDLSWTAALPMLRVRPETVSTETPPSQYGLPFPQEEFAGSIFDLEAGTSYEVRVTITDPDGGSSSQTITTSTQAAPRDEPESPTFVDAANEQEFVSAIQNATAGTVIRLAPATYVGTITVNNSGTENNPIVIRGETMAGVTIDASGSTYGVIINGSHVYLENVTVSGSSWGARAAGADGIVIRNSRFTSINYGIDARSGSHRNFYICDNILEGDRVWPEIGISTYNLEGITVSGQGHTICHNTVSGFGDALGLANETDIENISIDFYGNDVLWTGDDGIELDFARRNVRAFGNRVTNANMGISLQPVWGGPVYIFRNMFVNTASSPYKFNNDPTGFYVYNNTSIRTQGQGNFGGDAWAQHGYLQADGDRSYVANFEFKNNILIGLTGPADVTSELFLAEIDYNGWAPDGNFRFFDAYENFADVQSNSIYEDNGRVLQSPTFESPITLPPDYTAFWSNPDITLSQGSNAVDAGLALPNINDGYTGAGPDLGAWEFGKANPDYGVRGTDTVPPAPPQNISVE